MQATLLRLVGVSLMLCASARAESLSKGAAKEVVEAYFNSTTLEFQLGRQEVGTREMCELMRAESRGLVRVAPAPKAQLPFGFPLTPPHVQTHGLLVTISDKGKKLNLAKGKEVGEKIAIPQGRFTVSVAKTSEIKKGAEDFAVVYVTYKTQWNPDFYFIKTGEEGRCDAGAVQLTFMEAKSYKGILLFRKDAFGDKWIFVAGDYGVGDAELRPVNVNAELQK